MSDDNVVNLFASEEDQEMIMTCECGCNLCHVLQDGAVVCSECGSYASNMMCIEVEEIEDEEDDD